MQNRWKPLPLEHDPRATDLTLQILLLLDPWQRFELLATNWFHVFTGTNYRYTQERLSDLTRAELIGRFTFYEENNTEVFKYFRTPKGDRYVADHKYPIFKYDRAKVKHPHQIFSSYIEASLEYGVNLDPRFKLDTLYEVVHNERSSEEVRQSDYPFSFHIKGKRRTPDGRPRTLRRLEPKDAVLIFREDDKNTEQISTSEIATNIREKAEWWNVVFKNKLYKQKYGRERALLLFTTVNDTHKANIMREWEKVTGDCTWALFKSIPEFRKPNATIKPTTTLFDDPWHLIGYDPFSLKDI